MKTENLGKCYKLNFLYQMNHPEWTLVHGNITNMFPPHQTIDHAWCEKGNIIYDAVSEKEYDSYIYEALFKAEPVKKYNHVEAMKLADKTGIYGKWHDTDDSDIEKYYDKNGKIKEEYKFII